MTKTVVTIRNVDPSDKEYIDNLAKDKGVNTGTAFGLIVTQAKTAKSEDEIRAITNEKDEEISKLNETINKLTEELREFQKESARINAEIEEFKNREPETKTVEVEKQLTGNQFICEIPQNVTDIARKLRRFIKDDGHVPRECEGVQFANALAIVSMKYFINRNYIDLIEEKLK